MTPSYEDLQEQVHYLRDRLADATGQNLAASIRTVTGASGKGSRIIAMLYAARGVVTKDFILTEVFGDPATGATPDAGVVAVYICGARKDLNRSGAPNPSIRHDFNFGYYLTPDFRQWLKARLDGLDMAVAA